MLAHIRGGLDVASAMIGEWLWYCYVPQDPVAAWEARGWGQEGTHGTHGCANDVCFLVRSRTPWRVCNPPFLLPPTLLAPHLPAPAGPLLHSAIAEMLYGYLMDQMLGLLDQPLTPQEVARAGEAAPPPMLPGAAHMRCCCCFGKGDWKKAAMICQPLAALTAAV